MAETATIERCPNCALLLLRPKDTAEPRTARVEELLHQNHPPLDIELSAFRKVADDTLTALKDLDTKIVQAQELLENLRSARKQAQARVEDAKSILHPMRSIPGEILTQIFAHCIPTIYRPEDPDVLDPRGAPWLFSRVCRRWREFVLDAPQLWTHLLLDMDRHLGHITERQCAYKTGLFIERSRGLPMEVYIGSSMIIVDHPVIPALEVSVPRWRSLVVDLPRVSLQCLSGNNFVSLQRLWLRLQGDAPNLRINVFEPMRTPVLRDFEVVTTQSWRPIENVSLPWSRFTSIMNFPAFDVAALKRLRAMTELTRLHVQVNSKTRIPIHDVISLSKLRCLTIIEDEDAAGNSQAFFSALAIPALSELTLDYHVASELHFPAAHLSLRNVTKLDIICEMSRHDESTQRLLDFLALTPNVESLCLYDLEMTLEFVHGLNPKKIPDGAPLRLPCMRFLDIHKCEFAPALHSDLDQLFDMIFSRLRPLPPVRGTRPGAEGTVNGTDEQSVAADESVEDGYTRPRGEQYRCLKRVQIPRWLYIQMRHEPSPRFSCLTASVQLQGIP